ncbi:MAG: hypothetical protein ACXWV2_01170 [Chitinophagaceae bacterium]
MKNSKKPKPTIDFSEKDVKQMGAKIRKMKLSEEQIGKHLKLADAKSKAAVYTYTRGLLTTQKTKKQFIAEGKQLFSTSLKMNSPSRRPMIRAVIEETGRAGSLFLIQNISGLKKKDARIYMKDLLDTGGSVNDVAVWLQLAGKVLRKHNIKASGTAGAVVDALGDAGEWVIDTIEDGVDAILEGIDAIIDAIIAAGASFVDLFEEVISWTAEQMGDLLAALIEAGIALTEFVSAVFDWTYKAVSTFIEAAFAVGFAIADLLETVVSESYFVLRRFINGIIENLGPLGEILDFILTQAENAVSDLWRFTLRALRYAKAKLTDALDWMAAQTSMAFEGIIRAWEEIGESLMDIYEWALDAGALVWRAIGEATATIGNSIYYAYNFLTTSGVQFIFDFTRGLLDAGMAIAGIIGWAVDQAIEICGDIIRAALEAGITIGQMLVEIALDPGNALNTFIQGMQSIGQTLDDLFQAVIIETAEEFLNEVVEAVVEIGEAVVDILEAVLRVAVAAIANVIIALFNLLGTYRPLNNNEKADARTVFGNSLNYETIFLSNEDPLNKIIFGVQDFFTGNPDSRAFVTGNLINFDPSDNNMDRATLIHEITHVWQFRELGGIYLGEAIWAQGSGGDCATGGYNYGYDVSPVAAADSLDIESDYAGGTTNTANLGCDIGAGGEAALQAANGNFSAFNPEQQGQIMMHWFVRTQLEITDQGGVVVEFDSTDWDPYQQFVANA